jgi:hypothetical protein
MLKNKIYIIVGLIVIATISLGYYQKINKVSGPQANYVVSQKIIPADLLKKEMSKYQSPEEFIAANPNIFINASVKRGEGIEINFDNKDMSGKKMWRVNIEDPTKIALVGVLPASKSGVSMDSFRFITSPEANGIVHMVFGYGTQEDEPTKISYYRISID